LYIPLQIAATAWASFQAAHADAHAVLALAMSIGACSGAFGILAAHETIHSGARWPQLLGSLMLASISYPASRVAHLHAHHRLAATAGDPSTARLGESFFAFLPRTIAAQAAFAWRFERQRLPDCRSAILRNRLLQDAAITAALYAILIASFGIPAAVFMILQSAVAILVLELFNYVAHYGLSRRSGEPLTDRHSWNSSGLENLLLFNMGRHSSHHRSASAAYDRLRPVRGAPELPGGYAGAILLALVPPLWRSIMHPRLLRLGIPSQQLGYAGGMIPAATAS
jgi:alkane 1-monooxygenase